MADIIPITGEHQSVKSLLGSIMNDNELTTVIVYAFKENGACKFGHFEATVDQFALVSVAAAKIAQDSMFDE